MRVSGGTELSRLAMLQRQTAETRANLNRASTEAVTGVKTSRYEASGGNLSRLISVERALARNTNYSDIIAQTTTKVDLVQQTLDKAAKTAGDIALGMQQAAELGNQKTAMMQARLARDAFVGTVNDLNAEVNGQTLFSGTGADKAALADPEAMLTAISAAVSGATTSAGAVAAVDAYFAKPGGAFYTNGYLGTTEDVAPADVGDGKRIDYGTRADDDRIVSLLRSYALGAVIADGALPGNSTEQMAALKEAGSRILTAKEGILDFQSEVGITQERLENAKAERTAESGVLKTAQADMLRSDQEAQSTYFSELETQLKAIYTVTAKLTSLSFLDYMS